MSPTEENSLITYNSCCKYEGTRDYYESLQMPPMNECQMVTRTDGAERCVNKNGLDYSLSLD